MEHNAKLTVSEKEELAKKYLSRTETRQDFSLKHSIPVSTMDTWVKNYCKKNGLTRHRTKTFIPLIAEKSSLINTRTISIDFPSGVRMSYSGEIKFSDITTLASELNRITG